MLVLKEKKVTGRTERSGMKQKLTDKTSLWQPSAVFYTTLHLSCSHPATSTRRETSRLGPGEPSAEEHCPVLFHFGLKTEYSIFPTAKHPKGSKTVKVPKQEVSLL